MVGGSPASANLVVSCIIRQPMETVGVKYSKQASVSGFDPVRELMSSQIISTARTSKSNARDSRSRCGTSNSVGPVNNKHGLLNKSSFGLDITKSSSHSANRSASRPRGNSHETRSNNSMGGKQKRQSTSKTGAMGSIPNGYKHPHILTTMKPSKYVLRSPPGLQAQLLNILLKTEQDITHCELAFDEHGM